VASLATWIASLPPDDASVISALQIANEPALNSPGFMSAVSAFYREAVGAARKVLPTLPLVLNFIWPNNYGVDRLLNDLQREAAPIIFDEHWYLNWAGTFAMADEPAERDWAQIHSRACHTPTANWDWCSTYGNSIPVILGEWSLATNHDAPLDIDEPRTASELQRLFHEQLAVYTYDTRAPLVGHFFWTLRMGSGWDPRPTRDFPHGRHVGSSSSSRSLAGYPFQVWSLLELASHGIVTSLAAADAHACVGIPEP